MAHDNYPHDLDPLIQQLIRPLCAARLVVETFIPEAAYLPAAPLETISCHDILLAIRAEKSSPTSTRPEPVRTGAAGEFHRIEDAEREAACAVTLETLARRVQTAAQPGQMRNAPEPKTQHGQTKSRPEHRILTE